MIPSPALQDRAFKYNSRSHSYLEARSCIDLLIPSLCDGESR